MHLLAGEGHDAVSERFSPFAPAGVGGFLTAVGTVFVGYTGLTKVASVAEEIERPERNIPLGMLLAWLTVTVIYVAGTFVIVGALEREVLIGNETPVATAADAFMYWLPPAVGLIVITVAALAAFASTGNAGLMSASRYGFAMGRDRAAPERLARISRNGTPTYSIVLTSAAMIAAILLLDVQQLAKLASAFQLLIFTALCAAVVVFRKAQAGDAAPHFRSPLYPLPQIVGLAAYPVLIGFMGWLPVVMTLAMVATGTLRYLHYARRTWHGTSAFHRLLEARRNRHGA